MNFLIPFLPAIYRWAAIAAVGAALFGYGWIKGDSHGTEKLTEYIGKQAVETVRVARVRGDVTTRIEIKYLPMQAKESVITETIQKEVIVYVPSTDPDLSSGFRELHDAAAEGRLPDPARKRDGAPVAAQVVAGVVTENYGVCRADQLKLSELQEWVNEQKKVK